MSELHRAVQDEVAAHRPPALPPFAVIRARKRARDRRRTGLAAVGAAGLAAVAFAVLPAAGPDTLRPAGPPAATAPSGTAGPAGPSPSDETAEQRPRPSGPPAPGPAVMTVGGWDVGYFPGEHQIVSSGRQDGGGLTGGPAYVLEAVGATPIEDAPSDDEPSPFLTIRVQQVDSAAAEAFMQSIGGKPSAKPATMLGSQALIYSPVDRWRSLVAYTGGDLVQVNAMAMPDSDLRKIADGLRQRSVGAP